MDKISEAAFKGLIKVYEKKGYLKFVDFYAKARHVLSPKEQALLLSTIDSLRQPWNTDTSTDLLKEGDGGGFGGTVATSADSGFFTPTYGSNKKKKKYEQKAIPSQNAPTSNEANLKKALDQRHMENDTPKVSEFPSEMDNTAVEAEQEYVMQVEQIKDGEQNDRRSRESSLTEQVDPSEEAVRLTKDLDTTIEEVYYGRTTSVQKMLNLLKE
tara:strand:- start:477 stop:1115 length:639 start_codon:yes stop_codon:yes gene_type:complete